MTALWESQSLIWDPSPINSDTCINPLSEYGTSLFERTAPLLEITSITGTVISPSIAFLGIAFFTFMQISIFI